MRRRIALLRGINVGGHRKVPMADLRSLLTDRVGLADVATYIQSGNIVFTDTGGAAVSSSISAAIADHFGFEVPVIVRDAEVLDALLVRSAELFSVVEAAKHDKRVAVGFLTETPPSDRVAAIDPARSPGDVAIVEDDHVHLSYEVGQGSTKLTGDHLERVLGVGMTVRNLATLRKLADLA